MTPIIQRWLRRLSAVALGSALALSASWLWSLSLEQVASRPPVAVLETRLHAVDGRTVWIELRAVRRRDCALTATTQWQDADGIIGSRFNANKAILTPGEERWIRLRMDLPAGLSGGVYRVRSVAEYVCPGGKVFAVPTGWVGVRLI